MGDSPNDGLLPEGTEEDASEAIPAGPTRHREFINTLFRSCAERLRGTASRFVRNREDAEDIVQESLFAAYRHWGQFEGRAEFSTWLHSIVVNRSLMQLRSRKSKLALSLDETSIGEGGPPLAMATADPSPNPESQFEQKEQHTALRRVLDRLPERYRSVLHAFYLQELSITEGAAALGITISSFKSRLHRGRKKLGDLVGKPGIGRALCGPSAKDKRSKSRANLP